MKDWITENFMEIFSLLFGTTGIGYAVVTRWMNKKKDTQELRTVTSSADIKSDEFWKKRYDVLNEELKVKDSWWKERYENLYKELQTEKVFSNEMIKSFRAEFNQIRQDYEAQRECDRQRYDNLMKVYNALEEESVKEKKAQLDRIKMLEQLIEEYEKRVNSK